MIHGLSVSFSTDTGQQFKVTLCLKVCLLCISLWQISPCSSSGGLNWPLWLRAHLSTCEWVYRTCWRGHTWRSSSVVQSLTSQSRSSPCRPEEWGVVVVRERRKTIGRWGTWKQSNVSFTGKCPASMDLKDARTQEQKSRSYNIHTHSGSVFRNNHTLRHFNM